LIYKLLSKDHQDLAFLLAQSLHTENDELLSKVLPPESLLKIAALVAQCDFGKPQLWQELDKLLDKDHPGSRSGPVLHTIGRRQSTLWNKSVQLLKFSNTLPLALMAPYTSAGEILGELDFLGNYENLNGLRNDVIAFNQGNIPLGNMGTSTDLSREEWDQKVTEKKTQDKKWLEDTLNIPLRSPLGGKAWKTFTAPEGHVYSLLNPNTSSPESAIEKLNQLLGTSETKVITDAGKALRKGASAEERHRSGSFGHRDETKLLNRLQTAKELAGEWINILASKPENHDDFAQGQINSIRRSFTNKKDGAIQELKRAEETAEQYLEKSLYKLAQQTIKLCHHLVLQGNNTNKTIDIDKAIHGHLLLMPSINLNEEWKPDQGPTIIKETILKFLAEPPLDPAQQALEEHSKSGDLLSASRIIDLHMSAAAEKLHEERDTLMARHMKRLKEKADHIEALLSEFLQTGRINADEQQQWSSAVEKTRSLMQAHNVERFHVEFKILDDVEECIKTSELELGQQARERLSTSRATEEDLRRIETIVASGDIHLANDYIDKIENKEALPEEKDTTRLEAFKELFAGKNGNPPLSEKIKRALENPGLLRLLPRQLREGKDICGMNTRHLPVGEREEYAEALEAWVEMKLLQKVSTGDQDKIRKILTGLGFNVLSVEIEEHQNRCWAFVETEPDITHPVAPYGSEANGRYRILCEFHSSSKGVFESALDSDIRTHGADMVFYFRAPDISTRQECARLFRQTNRTVLIIDDITITYLASLPGRKISPLLETLMPFASFTPYSTQGSLISPEMFYGRGKEIAALESISANGSCLVYGGRQIGKTALLRHVERRTNESPGRVAKYMDLLYAKFCQDREPEELWSEIVKQLNEINDTIFPDPVPATVSAQWFEKKVKQWLNEDPERRILILLDEADHFLEADGRISRVESKAKAPFQICTELRGIMENTSRRFKVIFAGLHNVQRSTRTANNPLAQYGAPLCIGPLLKGTDAREARELIRQPLAHLGVFIDSIDLEYRILAHANYYPNLIQIYCQNLVDYIRDRQLNHGLSTVVPFPANSNVIEEVYERRELREALQLRFTLTLDLDKRFKLIAYLLAYHYLIDGDDGLDAAKLREEAITWWPDGFSLARAEQNYNRLISQEDFDVLLDEMVGLGILRQVEGEVIYRLRSPNVVSLLGTRHQIDAVLNDAMEWDPPLQYDPESFRSPLDGFRSPLTASQEGRIKQSQSGVIMLAGSIALGINKVEKRLKEMMGRNHFLSIKSNQLAPFKEELDQLRKKRKAGKTVIMISQKPAWDENWVEYAKEKIDNIRQPENPISIVFCLDPSKLWEKIDTFIGWEHRRKLTLSHWSNQAVGQWLMDTLLAENSSDTVSALEETTGLWPILLEQFAALHQPTVPATVIREATGLVTECTKGEFGLDVQGPMEILKDLMSFDDATTDDLYELMQEKDEKSLQKALRWAEGLSIISGTDEGWKVDPKILKILDY
jgi:hypothetical protein